MKQIALLMGLISSFYVFAQKAIINTPNTTVLYIGIPNPVNIYYPGVMPKDIVIKEKEGCAISQTGIQYYIKPMLFRKDCSFIVGIKQNNLINWVDTITIPAMNYPVGEARLGELGSGDYRVEEILKQKRLTYNNDCYFKDIDKNITFTKYRIILIPQTGQLELFDISDSIITNEIKSRISNLQSGDQFIIDGIKINLYEKEFTLRPLTIKIIENTTNYTSSQIEAEPTYKLDSLNDSTYYYVSYYPDGTKYQQGKVLIETNFRKYTYSGLTKITTEPFQEHLLNIHKGYFPISEWNIFDSEGNIQMTIHYVVIRDLSNTTLNTDMKNEREKFAIVPDGECIFYKNRGIIKEIIYYNKGVKR